MSKPPRRLPPRTRKTDAVVERIAGRAVIAKTGDPSQAGLFDASLPKWIKCSIGLLNDHVRRIGSLTN